MANVKKIGHYLFYLIEIAIVFALYTTLQEFYFYPDIFGFGSAEAFILSLSTVLVFWFSFWLYKGQLDDDNDWGFSQDFHWDWRKLATSVGGFFLMQLLYILLMNLIGGGVSVNQQNLDDLQQTAGPTYNIMVVLVAPIMEEIIFRGMFFNLLFNHAGKVAKWAGILVSGFFFAFAHNPFWSPYLLVYWMMGSVLAWVYMTTKDLRYSMATHIMWNMLSLFG